MQGNILKRDCHQFEINQDVDLRARLLMKEAECIIKDDAGNRSMESKISKDIAANIYIPKKSIGVENQVYKCDEDKPHAPLLVSHHSAGPELRFLRAKVKILTTEIDTLKGDQRKRVETLQVLESECHAIKEEKNKVAQHLASAEAKIAKMATVQEEHINTIKVLESVKSKLNNELQAAKKEAKASLQSAATMELRMNRALEEAESLKSTLVYRRGQEKDERDSQRKLIENQCCLIQKLERQQSELIMAFRRQMMLCHNLQRQKELSTSIMALNEEDAKFIELLSKGKKT